MDDPVQKEIERFLNSPEAEVLCVRGKWGVGKTFAWKRYLRDARDKDNIAKRYYSYLSLFGANSIDDLRFGVFENTINTSDIGIEPNLDTLKTNLLGSASVLGRRAAWFLQQIPLVKNYAPGLARVFYMSVRDTVVCFDDVERKGANLRIRDVLGLVSELKERKGCKIVLIMNEGTFDDDKEQTDFTTYADKVIDESVTFAPTPRESTRIALDQDTNIGRMLTDCCMTLGIANIRIIKRAERFLNKVEPVLRGFEEEILKQTVQTVALFTWSKYEPAEAPPWEWLKKGKFGGLFGTKPGQKIPEKEAAWIALLNAYNFSTIDEFDLVLLDGIENGFIDFGRANAAASELELSVKANKADGSLRKAWALYRESFQNNESEVLNAVYEASLKHLEHLSPVSLNSTVRLLKDFDQLEKAKTLIRGCIEKHGEDRKYFDLDEHPFREDIDDAEVMQAFKEKFESFRPEHDPAVILKLMAERQGWQHDDIATLASVPVENYVRIFEQTTGPDLLQMIAASLQFNKLAGATPVMLEISRRAGEALAFIAGKSKINARRISRYAIAPKKGDSNITN